MTLKEARKYIKQCERQPLRFERMQLISQGPGEGWCVSVARVAAAGAESARRREAEQQARQQLADEEGGLA